MNNTFPTHNILTEFTSNLISHSLSKSTVKFYRSDVSTFLKWLVNTSGVSVVSSRKSLSDAITFDTINIYKEFLIKNQYPSRTINRKLSALRHFLLFLDSSSVRSKTFKNISNGSSDSSSLINRFGTFLSKQHTSPITIKNYLSDIKALDNYLVTNGKGLALATSQEYKEYLSFIKTKKSLSSIKRASAAIKKFLEWHNPIDHVYTPLSTVTQKEKKYSFPILYIIGIGLLGSFSYISSLQSREPKLNKGNSIQSVMEEGTMETSLAPTQVTITSSRGEDFTMLLEDDSAVALSYSSPEKITQQDKALISGITESPDPYKLIYSEPDLEQDSISNRLTGRGILNKGTIEQMITNPHITPNSLIYITPTSSTEGKMLFVKRSGIGYFIVGLDFQAAEDISFNWLVLN